VLDNCLFNEASFSFLMTNFIKISLKKWNDNLEKDIEFLFIIKFLDYSNKNVLKCKISRNEKTCYCFEVIWALNEMKQVLTNTLISISTTEILRRTFNDTYKYHWSKHNISAEGLHIYILKKIENINLNEWVTLGFK